MAVKFFAAGLLLMTLVAASHGQIYLNPSNPIVAGEAPSPQLADKEYLLGQVQGLLCQYANVDCPDNGTGFETPPAPSPPSGPSPLAPGPSVQQLLSQFKVPLGRKLKM